MDILPGKLPAPRLFTGVAVTGPKIEKGKTSRPAAETWSGRSWRWLLVLALAGVIGVSAPSFHERYLRYREQHRDLRLLQVATAFLTAGPHSGETPPALKIEYAPEMLRVTAIALGHPRLAVINGRTVAEGDPLVVHAPAGNVTISLRVEKIADGYVDLFDGAHLIAAHLAVPAVKSSRP